MIGWKLKLFRCWCIDCWSRYRGYPQPEHIFYGTVWYRAGVSFEFPVLHCQHCTVPVVPRVRPYNDIVRNVRSIVSKTIQNVTGQKLLLNRNYTLIALRIANVWIEIIGSTRMHIPKYRKYAKLLAEQYIKATCSFQQSEKVSMRLIVWIFSRKEFFAPKSEKILSLHSEYWSKTTRGRARSEDWARQEDSVLVCRVHEPMSMIARQQVWHCTSPNKNSDLRFASDR